MEAARPIQQAPAYSVLAIIALIFAVLAWTLLPVMGFIMASANSMNPIAMPLAGLIIASVCGRRAQKKIHESQGMLLGSSMAKSARVMAYVQYTLIVVLLALAFLSMGAIMEHHISINVLQ
jgi:hypothetical protein